MTTDRAPSRARRCRHPSFAPTVSFLATARGRRPFRGLPPSDPAGPPNTNAGNALRPSPAFLLDTTAGGLASLRELPPSDLGAAETEWTLSATAAHDSAIKHSNTCREWSLFVNFS